MLASTLIRAFAGGLLRDNTVVALLCHQEYENEKRFPGDIIKYNPVKTRKENEPSRLLGDELEDYLVYLRSPWRIMWKNFLAGIFRGLGAILGASMVLAVLLWLLTLTQSFPLIGQYMRSIHQQVTSFIEEARYSDDFERVEQLLEQIVEQGTATNQGSD